MVQHLDLRLLGIYLQKHNFLKPDFKKFSLNDVTPMVAQLWCFKVSAKLSTYRV